MPIVKMKLFSYTVSVLVLFGLFAASTTSPTNRLAYYQQPSALYYQSGASPQQLVYLQYVQQPQPSQTYSYSTNAAYEFVASEAVATGTQNEDDVSGYQSDVDNLSEANFSSAEVENTDNNSPTEIPEESVTITPELQENNQPELPGNNQVLGEDVTTVTDDLSVDETTVEYETEPTNSEPSDLAVTEDAEDVDDTDTAADTIVSRNASGVTSKSAKAPLPAGTFFPIQFKGPTSGVAIAIANSFSTGEGGSATSHAIAYGQPKDETS